MKQTQNNNVNILSLVLLMAIVASTRFLSIPGIGAGHNFTALGGLAIFSGTYFKPIWKAIIITLATYFVSDVVLNLVIYKGQFGLLHNGFYIQYALITAISLLSNLLIKKVSITNVCITTLLGSLLFFLGSNFAVWVSGGKIPFTEIPFGYNLKGLLLCYQYAIPFFTNFLLSTLISAIVMISIQEVLVQKKSLKFA